MKIITFLLVSSSIVRKILTAQGRRRKVCMDPNIQLITGHRSNSRKTVYKLSSFLLLMLEIKSRKIPVVFSLHLNVHCFSFAFPPKWKTKNNLGTRKRHYNWLWHLYFAISALKRGYYVIFEFPSISILAYVCLSGWSKCLLKNTIPNIFHRYINRFHR